jgi:hypothetical protein
MFRQRAVNERADRCLKRRARLQYCKTWRQNIWPNLNRSLGRGLLPTHLTLTTPSICYKTCANEVLVQPWTTHRMDSLNAVFAHLFPVLTPAVPHV